MIDAHVHIERGPYSRSWIDAFVASAQAAGIDTLYLLEHSFRFVEFRPIYRSIEEHGEAGTYQRDWLSARCLFHLPDYKRLITEIRRRAYPITVKFGLEICYFPECEREIREALADFDWDFLTGAIHWIDGFGFDHEANLLLWQESDVNALYRRYYVLMVQAIESGLFDIIAHPDSIKCFNFYPSEDLRPLYETVALCASQYDVKMEFSSGLFINYGHEELGLNRELLGVLKKHGVRLVTASDAHRPEDVGKGIGEAELILSGCRA